jgi:hypothetical protein
MNPTKEQNDKLQQAAGTDQKVKEVVKRVGFYSAGTKTFWQAHDHKSVPRREVQFNYLTEAQWREHGPLLTAAWDRVRDELKREAGEADAQHFMDCQPARFCDALCHNPWIFCGEGFFFTLGKSPTIIMIDGSIQYHGAWSPITWPHSASIFAE